MGNVRGGSFTFCFTYFYNIFILKQEAWFTFVIKKNNKELEKILSFTGFPKSLHWFQGHAVTFLSSLWIKKIKWEHSKRFRQIVSSPDPGIAESPLIYMKEIELLVEVDLV